MAGRRRQNRKRCGYRREHKRRRLAALPALSCLWALWLLSTACADGPAGPDGESAQAGESGRTAAATPRASDGVEPAETAPWPLPRAVLDPEAPAAWTVEILQVRPHDPTAFTQGLELHDGLLIESTGLYGESRVRLTDPLSGEVVVERELAAHLFGEGVTRIGDTVIQLTWKAGTALRWRLPGLDPLDPLAYEGEGWGACADGDVVITSDGSSRISHRHPSTFEVLATADVTLRGEPLHRLNELECIDGLVVANIWQSNSLVVFDPDDGAVLAEIDASVLDAAVERPDDPEAVLNGIADLGDGTLLLTGKLWPSSAVVRLSQR